MSFVDTEDTGILYLHARPKRGCDAVIAETFGKMVDLCQDMYEKRRNFNIRTELGSRKKLTILFVFESAKDKQAFEESKRYQELFVDLQAFCKRDKLFTASKVQMSIVKVPEEVAHTGAKIFSVEEVSDPGE